MVLPPNLIGTLFAISAAVVWGSSDFSGGFATRRTSTYQVLALSALSGVILLLLTALIWQESFPSWQGILWSMLAGIVGAVGLSALYYALSLGNSAIAAPTSAVVGATLPIFFTLLTKGLPSLLKIIGFVLAILGIWLVSYNTGAQNSVARKAFWLACFSGICFGCFFILIAQVEAGKVITPLVISRSMVFLTGLLLLRKNRLPFPSLTIHPVALLTGVLDVSGNVLFLLAKQFTRLDTAVILSSMNPAVIILLAKFILKETITLRQWLGIVACLAAILLISM
jgi:drug/metabolite transporter (DMT)-like permease